MVEERRKEMEPGEEESLEGGSWSRSASLRLSALYQHKLAVFGALVIILTGLTAIFAPYLAPHDPLEMNFNQQLASPSWNYPFGTDYQGRCVFSRVLYGSRIALAICFLLVGIQAGIGVPIGLIAGYAGGKTDEFLMRFTDMVWSLPPLVLALAFVMILGAGIVNVIIALSIVSWAQFARVTRSKVQSIKNEEFVEAARAAGDSNLGILWHEILPNVLAPNIVLATLALPTALLQASAMSFLGFGAQPPTPEWGAILSAGREYLRVAPWIASFPGLAIMIVVLAFNFLGDGLRDAFDPKLRRG